MKIEVDVKMLINKLISVHFLLSVYFIVDRLGRLAN